MSESCETVSASPVLHGAENTGKYASTKPEESRAPLFKVGCGEDLTIRELAGLIRDVVGFKGRLTFDASKPDGTQRKLLEVSRMKQLGWHAGIPLCKGLAAVYEEYSTIHTVPQGQSDLSAQCSA